MGGEVHFDKTALDVDNTYSVADRLVKQLCHRRCASRRALEHLQQCQARKAFKSVTRAQESPSHGIERIHLITESHDLPARAAKLSAWDGVATRFRRKLAHCAAVPWVNVSHCACNGATLMTCLSRLRSFQSRPNRRDRARRPLTEVGYRPQPRPHDSAQYARVNSLFPLSTDLQQSRPSRTRP